MAVTRPGFDPAEIDRMFLRIHISVPYEKDFAFNRIAALGDVRHVMDILRKEVLRDLAMKAKERLDEIEKRITEHA